MLPSRISHRKQFSLRKRLKEGAEGEVYCAYDHVYHELRAVKIKPSGSGFDQKPLEEVECLMILSNEHCLRLHDHFVDPWDNTLWMVTEYCNGGDMEDYLRSLCTQGGGLSENTSGRSGDTSSNTSFTLLPEPELRDLMAQLLMGLVHIHANCIIHRDIKLANILLHNPWATKRMKTEELPLSSTSLLQRLSSQRDTSRAVPTSSASSPHRVSPSTPNFQDTLPSSAPPATAFQENEVPPQRWIAKIADFGSSKRLATASEYGKRTRGTPFFSSPEMIQQQSYTIATDVWSLGVCFYAMLTAGRLPFPTHTECTTESDLRRDITHSTPLHPCDVMIEGQGVSPYSRALGDVVMEMLTKPFSQRPSASDLLSRRVFQPSFCHLYWRGTSFCPRTTTKPCEFRKEEKQQAMLSPSRPQSPMYPHEGRRTYCGDHLYDRSGTHSPQRFFLCSSSLPRDQRPSAIPYMAVDRSKDGVKVYAQPRLSSTVLYRLFYGDQVYVHPIAMGLGDPDSARPEAFTTPQQTAFPDQKKLSPTRCQSPALTKTASARPTPSVLPSVLWVKILYPILGFTIKYMSNVHHLLPLCELPSTLIPSSVAFCQPSEILLGPPDVPRRFESESTALGTSPPLRPLSKGSTSRISSQPVEMNSFPSRDLEGNDPSCSAPCLRAAVESLHDAHTTFG